MQQVSILQYGLQPSIFTFSNTFETQTESIYLYLILILDVCQAAISIKTSNLLICFCNIDFSSPILEKDNFIENVYIVLSFIK